MKKIALAVLLASGLMAADSGVYVGVDVGNTEYEGTANWNYSGFSGSENAKSDGSSQTLKIGYYFDANNRVNAFIQNISIDDAKAYSYGVGYDYLIGSNAFKPFVGVFVGGNTVSPDDESSASGAIYGAQIGLNYAINANFSAEAGYRYMGSTMEEEWTDGVDSESYEIDSMNNWFVGLNYKF